MFYFISIYFFKIEIAIFHLSIEEKITLIYYRVILYYFQDSLLTLKLLQL